MFSRLARYVHQYGCSLQDFRPIQSGITLDGYLELNNNCAAPIAFRIIGVTALQEPRSSVKESPLYNYQTLHSPDNSNKPSLPEENITIKHTLEEGAQLFFQYPKIQFPAKTDDRVQHPTRADAFAPISHSISFHFDPGGCQLTRAPTFFHWEGRIMGSLDMHLSPLPSRLQTCCMLGIATISGQGCVAATPGP
ncbi:hypothetical protein HNY73_004975 [Argiope bruennichi]|uniref:Uncharacterized protein n=1 Tax=Argiope bruennichi TaxID=94029 RepID=A0A8T0FXE2_ARGBR|nr:hypothetical protein HNY73_004975 [Argiope bruennichi]